MRRYWPALVLSACLHGQTWTSIPLSSLEFRDFTGQGRREHPYYPLYLPFPRTTVAVPDLDCAASKSEYQWHDYLAFSTTGPDPICLDKQQSCRRSWVGPLTGAFRRNPSQVFITRSTHPLKGLEFAGVFSGTVTGATDPNNALTQAVFVHQRRCYDGGPEFGFLRNLRSPLDSPDTIYFYFSDTTNCTGAAWGYRNGGPDLALQTTCFDPAAGRFVSSQLGPNDAQGYYRPHPIPAPTWPNSIGESDWLYRAYVSGPAQFTVAVLDPYNGTRQDSIVVNVGAHPNEEFFQKYTRQMWNGQFRGWVTITINKTVDRGPNYANRGDVAPNRYDSPAIGITRLGLQH